MRAGQCQSLGAACTTARRLYVPYFWEQVEQDSLEGRAVGDKSRTVFVHLIGETDPIRTLFPELGKKTAVRLWAWNDEHILHVEEL
jgi:hypothetical protein